MYAIIQTCGKQYRVAPGNVLTLEKLEGNVGQTLTFDKVLLIGGKEGKPILVGTPYVEKALTSAEIVAQTRGDKILTIKYKRRKGYRRTIGHRQYLTRVLVTKIEDGNGASLQLGQPQRIAALRRAGFLGLIKTQPKKQANPTAQEAKPVTSEKKSKTISPKITTTRKAKVTKKVEK